MHTLQDQPCRVSIAHLAGSAFHTSFTGLALHTLQGQHTKPETLTSKSKIARARGHIAKIKRVFVFTLDCNNCIYCYGTGDDIANQPTGRKTKLTEVSFHLVTIQRTWQCMLVAEIVEPLLVEASLRKGQ